MPALAAATAEFGSSLQVTGDLPEIQAGWQALAAARAGDAAQVFDANTALMDRMVELMFKVGSTSTLALDPMPDTYGLKRRGSSAMPDGGRWPSGRRCATSWNCRTGFTWPSSRASTTSSSTPRSRTSPTRTPPTPRCARRSSRRRTP